MQRDGAALLRMPMQTAAFGLVAALSLAAFSGLLLLAGKHPWQEYVGTITYVFGNASGFAELDADDAASVHSAAAALPARIGLINVGGEGQLYMGAWLTTAGELALQNQPATIVLPALTLLGFIGGGLWALIWLCCALCV